MKTPGQVLYAAAEAQVGHLKADVTPWAEQASVIKSDYETIAAAVLREFLAGDFGDTLDEALEDQIVSCEAYALRKDTSRPSAAFRGHADKYRAALARLKEARKCAT